MFKLILSLLYIIIIVIVIYIYISSSKMGLRFILNEKFMSFYEILFEFFRTVMKIAQFCVNCVSFLDHDVWK